MSFDECFEKVIISEGGDKFTDDPLDNGGATKYGITLRALSEYIGRIASKDEVRNLSKDLAKEIYRKNYWDKLSLDEIKDPTIQYVIFDQAVNKGLRQSIIQAQMSLVKMRFPTVVDGIMGQKTILSLNEVDPTKFLFELIKHSQSHYVSICSKTPAQLRFLSGWINRTHHLIDEVLKCLKV